MLQTYECATCNVARTTENVAYRAASPMRAARSSFSDFHGLYPMSDEPTGQPPESFGERMKRLKQERGESGAGPGRKRIRDKHGRLADETLRIFGEAMPEVAQTYLDELNPKEPERCAIHGQVLRCPVDDCTVESERTEYNHKAAAYVFDRVMGKPTTRSENVVTVRLVQELVAEFIGIFRVVNELPDADSRQAAYAQRCLELGAKFGGAAA